MRSVLPTLLVLTCGCVTNRATLLPEMRNVVTTPAPVVCGPMGFRRVPLQTRWGEYLRVTIRSPAPLQGAARVFAGGRALPLTRWQAGAQWQAFSEAPLVLEGAFGASLELTGRLELPAPLANTYETVVVATEFPNEDPDARSALSASSPIDVTLSELEGASCDGAVLIVEQGALVPSVSEAAWLAELERRGGSELQARREAARRAADERRSAYLAELEVRTAARRQAQAELAARLRWCGAHVGSCPEIAVRAPVLPETLRLALQATAAASSSTTAEAPGPTPGPQRADQTPGPWHAGLAAGLAIDAPGCGWPQCASRVQPLPGGLQPAPFLPGPEVPCRVTPVAAGAGVVAPVALTSGSVDATVAAASTDSVDGSRMGGAVGVLGAAATASGEVGSFAGACAGAATLAGRTVGAAGVGGPSATVCGAAEPAGSIASVGRSSDGSGLAADPRTGAAWPFGPADGTACSASGSLPSAGCSASNGSDGATVGGTAEGFAAWPAGHASVAILSEQTAAGAAGAVGWAESGEWSMPAQAEWELPAFGQRESATTAAPSAAASPRRVAHARMEVTVVPFLVDLIGFGLGVAASQRTCAAGCQPVHPAVPVTR